MGSGVFDTSTIATGICSSACYAGLAPGAQGCKVDAATSDMLNETLLKASALYQVAYRSPHDQAARVMLTDDEQEHLGEAEDVDAREARDAHQNEEGRSSPEDDTAPDVYGGELAVQKTLIRMALPWHMAPRLLAQCRQLAPHLAQM